MSSEETPNAPEVKKTEGTATPEQPAAADAPAQTTAADAPAQATAADAPAKTTAADAPAVAAPQPAAAAPAAADAPVAEVATSTTVAVATASPDAEGDTIRSSTYTPPVGGDGSAPSEPEKPELSERVVTINRCSKVVKGGRRFSFSALVVAGDRAGKVGFGFGKANEVAECIRKASESAQTSLEPITLRGTTIPHETIGEYGGGKVLLRPASPGTGIIAGTSVRAVVEAAGITDILTKSLGSNNHFNVVKATLAGLRSLRSREQIYKLRGKKVAEKKAL